MRDGFGLVVTEVNRPSTSVTGQVFVFRTVVPWRNSTTKVAGPGTSVPAPELLLVTGE
jgi:hypothetical protein